MQAESNGDHDKKGCHNEQSSHRSDESIIRVEDQVTTLADALLCHRVASDSLNEPITISTFFTSTRDLDYHDLLSVS